MPSPTITVRLPADLLSALDALAQAEGKSRSELVADTLRARVRAPKAEPRPLRKGAVSGRGKVPTSAPRPEPCSHPIGRRIGNGCGQCGKLLK